MIRCSGPATPSRPTSTAFTTTIPRPARSAANSCQTENSSERTVLSCIRPIYTNNSLINSFIPYLIFRPVSPKKYSLKTKMHYVLHISLIFYGAAFRGQGEASTLIFSLLFEIGHLNIDINILILINDIKNKYLYISVNIHRDKQLCELFKVFVS